MQKQKAEYHDTATNLLSKQDGPTDYRGKMEISLSGQKGQTGHQGKGDQLAMTSENRVLICCCFLQSSS